MSKCKLIKFIEVFQSLLRKTNFDPDEATFLELPGRPKEYFESSMLCLYMVMILKKIKSFRGLWRFISCWENRYVAKACGFGQIPSRETIRLRIQEMQPIMEKAVAHIGQRFVDQGLANPRHVAVDSRMFEALGPKWHASDRKRATIPEDLRGVDKDSRWKKSRYRGWVQGYGLSIVCTATPEGIVLPLLARAHANSASEAKIFQYMIYRLPPEVRFVLADEAYDDKELYRKIDRKDENNNFCRRLVVPIKIESLGPNSRQDRVEKAQFFHSTRGQKIYSRRMSSVERIFSRLIDTFDARKVWFKGKHFNFPFLVMLVLAYQALVYFNYMQGSKEITVVKSFVQTI